MNKKEIAEIKKQYKPEYSCIGKIAGCYVDKDKNKAANGERICIRSRMAVSGLSPEVR